jgi:uncharacterized membrane-anchored protein YhcB (DUF1043 family)
MMLESLTVETWIAAGAAGLVLALLGFAIGRRTGAGAAAVRRLEEELDTVRVTATQRQEELDDYRGRVAEHFSDTSQKLHELTVHYRGVYEHLAQGASDLCPEGFEQLDAGLGLGALPDQSGPGLGGLPDQTGLALEETPAEESPEPESDAPGLLSRQEADDAGETRDTH